MNRPCHAGKLNMAADSLLEFFGQVRGIKFYDLSHVGAREGDRVILEREPVIPMTQVCQCFWVGVVEDVCWATSQGMQQSGSLQCSWVFSASPHEYFAYFEYHS